MSSKQKSIEEEAEQVATVKGDESIESSKTDEKKVNVVRIKLKGKVVVQIMETTYNNIVDLVETAEIDFQRALWLFADMGSMMYKTVKAGMVNRAKDAVAAVLKGPS